MAGWLLRKLGYGSFEVVDVDNPGQSPSVTASVAAPSYDTFTRILQSQFSNNEEVRIDRPVNYNGGSEYVAIAPSGSSTAAPVWNCVRCVWVNKKKTRLQYRQQIAWDQRDIGW